MPEPVDLIEEEWRRIKMKKYEYFKKSTTFKLSLSDQVSPCVCYIERKKERKYIYAYMYCFFFKLSVVFLRRFICKYK